MSSKEEKTINVARGAFSPSFKIKFITLKRAEVAQTVINIFAMDLFSNAYLSHPSRKGMKDEVAQ